MLRSNPERNAVVDRCRVAVDPADGSSEPHFVPMKFGEVYGAAADDWFSSVPGRRTTEEEFGCCRSPTDRRDTS